MYDVSTYNPQTVEPIPPNGVDHAVYDGSPSRTLDGFIPPAEVQDKGMQTATVRVLPATGYAGMPQHLAFLDPMVDADDNIIGYTQFVCSCRHARFGQPCRHYVAVLHRGSIPVFFHMGLFHEQWFAEQQPYVQQVEMVQPSQPHLAVVESTIHRSMPTPTGDVPAVEMPATIDVDTTAAAMEANRGRLFNNLMAIAKRIITGAVEAGPEKCKQVEAGLHALAVSITAPPPLQHANPPPRAKRYPSAKRSPQAKRQRKEPVAKPAPRTEAPTPPTPYPGPVVSTTPTPLPTAVGNVALPFPDMSQLPLAPLIPQMFDTTLVAMSGNMSLGLPQGMLSQSYTQPLWQPTAMPLAPTTMPLALQMQMQPHLLG